jgi:hypothetical protein
VRFLCTTRENATHLNEDAIRRGVYQVLMLELAYVTPDAREAVHALCAEFYVPLNKALENAS